MTSSLRHSALDMSVLIPTLGSYQSLERVLDGLSGQTAETSQFEVIVAVDALDPDPDRVEAAIGQRAYPVRLVRGALPGASANRNAAIHASRAPLILFTDNDTIPSPTLVTEHLAWHLRHTDSTAAILGLIRWAPEIRVTAFMKWLDTGIQFDYANIRSPEAGWGRFYTANVSVKRRLLNRVGLFDEVHLPYLYEDTDWAYRASKHGLKVLFNPAAVVDHLKPVTLDAWKRRAPNVARAEWTFTQLHPETSPWFHRLFTEAMQYPRARGRSISLARYVSPRWPAFGPRLWATVDIAYKQAIAPHFLAGWREAQASMDALVEGANDDPGMVR